MPRRWWVACLLALLLRPVAAAQEATPAAPPEAPAAARLQGASGDAGTNLPADASPKDTLKRLAAALRDGNAPQIRRLMHATSPSETKMVAAMADMAGAMAELQRAAVKTFGPVGAKDVVGDTDATDAHSRDRIEAADVKVQGDTATVTMEDGEEAPVVLKRVEGRWKLPVADLSRGADAAVLDERLAGLALQARLVRELAEEIQTGKYTSPAQAHEAWQSRAMQASMTRPQPKKPATSNAADPGSGAKGATNAAPTRRPRAQQ